MFLFINLVLLCFTWLALLMKHHLHLRLSKLKKWNWTASVIMMSADCLASSEFTLKKSFFTFVHRGYWSWRRTGQIFLGFQQKLTSPRIVAAENFRLENVFWKKEVGRLKLMVWVLSLDPWDFCIINNASYILRPV